MSKKRGKLGRNRSFFQFLILAFFIFSAGILIFQSSGLTGFSIYGTDSLGIHPEINSPEDILAEQLELGHEPVVIPEEPLEPFDFPESEYSAEYLHDLDKVSPNLIVQQAVGGDYLGRSVSSGDINNDGINDFIIGAHRTDSNGADSGTTYVIFGSGSFLYDSVYLSTTPANLTIYGEGAGDRSGFAVASGDINNDNIDDVIIGAYLADPNGGESGKAYVIFGSSSYTNNVINLSTASANITVYGNFTDDRLGWAVASGDINNDSIDDLIVGAPLSNPNGGNSGETYVIFGSSSYTNNVINISSDKANLTIKGNSSGDYLGTSIYTGDINNDGIDDVITGAYGADPHGGDEGATYVIFGSSSYTNNVIDLNLAQANLTIYGDDTGGGEFLGYAVSSGDINNDSIDDVITAAYAAPDPAFIGRTYVIFGSSSYTNTIIDLDTATANLTVQGIDFNDQSGRAVASGDVNNDGIDDVIIGAYGGDPHGSGEGEVYVIFGSSSYTNDSINLAVSSANLTIYGDNANDQLGTSLFSSDINDDGIDDILIGADTGGKAYAFLGTYCSCTNCSECQTNLNDQYCWFNRLAQNASSNGTCVDFPASNKVFDCFGNTIIGNGSDYGINMSGRSNVRIQNCVISNFSRGLALRYSSDNNLTNIQVSETSGYGVYIFMSHRNNIINVNTRDGYYGYSLSGSYNNVLDNITVYNHHNANYGGIFSSVAANNSYNNLNLYNNSPYGIFLYESEGNNITNSSFDNSSQYGILLSGDYCRNIRVINVNASRNIIAGIRLYLAKNNIFTNLNLSGNYNDGLSTNSANNSRFTNIITNDNTDDGIYIDFASSNNTFINGSVIGNDGAGIYMGHSSNNNTFTNLTIHSNNNGISLSSCSYTEFINLTNYNHTTGISLSSSNNNLIKDSAVRNCSTGVSLSSSDYNLINNTNISSSPTGVKLSSSSHNNITYNRFFDNRGSGDALYVIVPTGGFFPFSNNHIAHNLFWNNTYGLRMSNEDNNTVDYNTFWNNDYAIYLINSTQNNFTGNRINISNNWDVVSNEYSPENKFWNLTIGTAYPTSIDFVYANGVKLKSVESPPQDPAHYYNISKYANITNQSASSWLFLNISYSDAEAAHINESLLKIWKYNSSGWQEDGWNGSRILDTTNNVVGANITNFASIFGALSFNNTAPNTTFILVNATSPNNYTTDNLTCWFRGEDFHQDILTARVRWANSSDIFNFEIIVPNNVTSSDSLESSYTKKGELWICSVQMCDEYICESGSINDNIIILNSPPVAATISNQTWNEDTANSNAFDLDDYFSDADDDNLTYNYTQTGSNITINVSADNVVSFSQPADWYGVEYVVFDATDGTPAVQSNNVTLTVTDVAEPAAPSGGGGAVRPRLCVPFWKCGSWSECINGIQTRTCIDEKNCSESYEETRDCVPASCTDGILNQGELKVNQVMSTDSKDISDCGGPYCPACPTCKDGVQNQGETGVDCGGPCSPCASCFDEMQNQGETGVDCGGPCAPCLEAPVEIKEINLFWLLIILLIAITLADGYCIYQHYHKKTKSAKKTYEILTILLLVGVIALSSYLAYTTTAYILMIPISLIIFIIIVTWHFSMPELIAKFEKKRKERFAKKKKVAAELKLLKELKKIRIKKEEIIREKAEPKIVAARVKKEKAFEAERRKREAVARERAQLREERARLLEEQKRRRQEEIERERAEKAKERQKRRIERQKEKEKKSIDRVRKLTIARIKKEKKFEAKRREREAKRRKKERERLEKEELKRKKHLKKKEEKEKLADVLRKKKLEAKRERKEKWIEELGEKEELAGVLEKKRLEREGERKKRTIEELERKENIEQIKEEHSEELNKFINNAINKGFTKEQVKKALIKQGWPKKFVKNYCDKFFEIYGKKDLTQIRKTTAIEGALEEERENALESLNKFIKNSLRKGRSKNRIKKELIKAGWPSRFIRDYMKRFFG